MSPREAAEMEVAGREERIVRMYRGGGAGKAAIEEAVADLLSQSIVTQCAPRLPPDRYSLLERATRCMFDAEGRPLFDVVARTEHIDAGFSAVMAHLGEAHGPLPQQPQIGLLGSVGAQPLPHIGHVGSVDAEHLALTTTAGGSAVVAALLEHAQQHSFNDQALFARFFPSGAALPVWMRAVPPGPQDMQ